MQKNVICHLRKTRVCSICEVEKDFSEFNSWVRKDGTSVTRPECKKCHSRKIATKRLEAILERDDRYGQCSNEDCLKIQKKNKTMECRECGCLIDE
jgi:hypothetical protein